MVAKMELTDRQILNAIQSTFPLEPEPFHAIGRLTNVSGEEVIQRIATLKAQNIVRQISAIFDTRRLGHKTSLVAARYPQASLTRAAHHINGHCGVSHNYARNGYFNLWFTLAVPPGESLEAAVERLGHETGAEAIQIMPAIRVFKLSVNFDMVEGKGAAHDRRSANGHENGQANWNKAEPLTDHEIQVIREIQEDLPLQHRPFEGMSERLGISEAELLACAHAFQERGVMRRFGAVLNHRQAGFSSNGMGVWEVPPDRSEEVGRIMASHPAVSHCYQRPTFPNLPYSHFSMIHATSREGCEEEAREIARQTGITEYQVLYSYREYKKTRVRYFV